MPKQTETVEPAVEPPKWDGMPALEFPEPDPGEEEKPPSLASEYDYGDDDEPGDAPVPPESTEEGAPAEAPEADAETPGDETVTPAEPKTPQFDEAHLSAARQAGLPEPVARAFGSQEQLAAYLQAKQAPAEPVAEPEPLTLEPYKLDLGGLDDYDDKLVAQLDGMNKHYAEQVAQLTTSVNAMQPMRQQVQQSAAALENAARAAELQAFDAAVDALGHKELFGEGSGKNLAADSTERANRVAVWQEYKRMQGSYNGNPPAYDKLIAKAFRSEFGDQVATLERSKIEQAVKQRSSQMIARPSGRTGKALAGDEKTIAAINAIWQERGGGPEDMDEEF
jgi:hypothetical protein